jgi:hypothetical protein
MTNYSQSFVRNILNGYCNLCPNSFTLEGNVTRLITTKFQSVLCFVTRNRFTSIASNASSLDACF